MSDNVFQSLEAYRQASNAIINAEAFEGGPYAMPGELRLQYDHQLIASGQAILGALEPIAGEMGSVVVHELIEHIGQHSLREANSRIVAVVALLKTRGDVDPWVPVLMKHLQPNRSTMLRHSENPQATGVRNVGRKYEIRKSKLATYLEPQHRQKYGVT